jgi:microcin C transport system substrate-binding protein
LGITRRTVLTLAAAAPIAAGTARFGVCASVPAPSTAEGDLWKHGLSLFGELKYPPGFERFGYVNASAPKGGTVRQAAFGTYDNFNLAVAGLKGHLAIGIGLIYDTLLIPSMDEVSASYGLVAEAVRHPADISSATYRLRRNAKWHDGEPVTVDDVIFSFESFKAHSPQLAIYYRHVVDVKQTDEHEITFRFDAPGYRELPLILGQLIILPKHWWDGRNASGQQRVDSYWGKDLNVRVGRDNFDEMGFDYYRDLAVMFESFKAGQYDWHVENSSKNWATGYDFPAVREKRVILEEFPIRNVGIMQAFAFNIRRAKFGDPRLRQAFNYAFNFEEMNRDIFHGQYQRITSYFQRTELASSGLPAGRELELLEPLRNLVPPQVFTTAYRSPTSRNAAEARANLLKAMHLLEQAGYEVRDMHLVAAGTGQRLAVEFLLPDQMLKRFVLFYVAALERLGMDVSVRVVDAVQYQNRLRQWDFDIVVATWPQTLTPGNEQRAFWGSRAADMPGSLNIVGIKNEAVDALIDKIVHADRRDEHIAATRALDRVLLWNHYVVPQWTYPNERTARWDRFARPAALPIYGESAFPTIWWNIDSDGGLIATGGGGTP